eukprot:4468252-Karenia_brevis.AAC.1
MNVTAPAADEREIEVLASSLPLFNGAQLAVDITLRSSLSADGQARLGADVDPDSVLQQARQDKESKYSELVRGRRCRLVVVALTTGGRWSEEAFTFVRDLAVAKARDSP